MTTAWQCSTFAEFAAMSVDDRETFLASVQQEAMRENVGRKVRFDGREWEIIGVNYVGDYDITRIDERGDIVQSSCVLGLPEWHPHFAELLGAT